MNASTYELKTRPCSIYPGQFRWTVFENGNPVRFSPMPFLSESLAASNGIVVVRELEALKRLEQRG